MKPSLSDLTKPPERLTERPELGLNADQQFLLLAGWPRDLRLTAAIVPDPNGFREPAVVVISDCPGSRPAILTAYGGVGTWEGDFPANSFNVDRDLLARLHDIDSPSPSRPEI